MKNIFFTFFLLIISCGSIKKSNNNDRFKIIKRETHDNYTLFFANRNNDTLVFVCENSLFTKCKRNKKHINKLGLEEVSNLVTESGDSLIFIYSVKDVSKNYLSIVGGGKPGQNSKKYIDTYYSFPLQIKKCESFVN